MLITIFTLFLTGLKAEAAVLTQRYLAQEIRKQAQTIIKKELNYNLNIETDDYYISNITVPGNNFKIQVSCSTRKFNPVTIFKVNILSEGKIMKTFGVPISISIFESVAVAAKDISRDEPLSSSNIKYETREISLINNNNILTSSDVTDNFIADKQFKADEILDRRFIKTPPDVLMYNPVSLIFENEDITISLDGEALDSGRIGEYIRVKNKLYKKQYRGQIIDKNKVMVKL